MLSMRAAALSVLAIVCCGGQIAAPGNTGADASGSSDATSGSSSSSSSGSGSSSSSGGSSGTMHDAGSGGSDAALADSTFQDASSDGGAGGDAGDASMACPPGKTDCGGTCVDEQTDPNNCGACLHSCQGGPCSNGSCQPFVFLSGLAEPENIVHDSTRVYWATAGGGTVMSCPSASTCGTPATLAGLGIGQFLAIDNQNVYFGAYSNTAQTYQCPLGGCNGTPLDLGAGSGPIFVDNTNVYWTFYAGNQLLSCAIGGCGGSASVIATPTSPGALAGDPTHLYWADRTKVASCVSSNCAATITTLAPASAVNGMTVDTNNLYWIEASSGDVYQCAIGGCGGSPIVLQHGPSGAAVIAVDATDVYWVTDNPGSLVRCAIGGCGGSPTVLATSQPPSGSPAGLTLDAKSIFWTDRWGGVIMKLAK